MGLLVRDVVAAAWWPDGGSESALRVRYAISGG
jgi:hypothetical protein